MSRLNLLMFTLTSFRVDVFTEGTGIYKGLIPFSDRFF